MLSTRFISTLFALFAFLTFAFAAPLAVEQRGLVPALPVPLDLPTILTDLGLKIKAILERVDELAETGGLLEKNVGGILEDVITTTKSCAADVGTVMIAATSYKRQEVTDTLSLDDTAALVKPILTDITLIVNKVTTVAGQNPAIGILLVTVSTTSTELLNAVNTLVPGLLSTVQDLVHTLTGIIVVLVKGLGLGAIVQVLNLGL